MCILILLIKMGAPSSGCLHKFVRFDFTFRRNLLSCVEFSSCRIVLSLSNGKVPSALKISNVVPVFKKGNADSFSNYGSLHASVGIAIILKTIRNYGL